MGLCNSRQPQVFSDVYVIRWTRTANMFSQPREEGMFGCQDNQEESGCILMVLSLGLQPND